MKKITETHNVGPCLVTATYEYLAPEDASSSPVVPGRPGVKATLLVPADDMRDVLANRDITVFGKPFSYADWTKQYCYFGPHETRHEMREDEVRLETLLESLECLRARVVADVADIRRAYADRCAAQARAEAVNPFADDQAPAPEPEG
jgi:hypothetical protein